MTGKSPCCSAGRPVSENPLTVAEVSSTKGSQDGMILLSGGSFLMGSDDDDVFADDGEGPVREIQVNPFYIGSTVVTNAEFAEFISSTAYLTEAEKFGWSFVFEGLLPDELKYAQLQVVQNTPWWCAVEGANWKCPQGGKSECIEDHPVVHVSWNDAVAFCNWAGKRLPTEAEWEFAARGGLMQNRFPWGNELSPQGKFMCNIWQGTFPDNNSMDDGFLGTAPAKSFPANGYGLYNMAGNVWEWSADWFRTDHDKENKSEPASVGKVIKGGSFLCHESYCNRYRVSARSQNTPDSTSSNIGFRCAMNA